MIPDWTLCKSPKQENEYRWYCMSSQLKNCKKKKKKFLCSGKRRKQWQPHSSTLVWRIPWTEEPGKLQPMGSLRDTTERLHFHFSFHTLEKEMATHSSVLAWRIPGMGEPGGLPSMGSHRVGHNWSDLAAAALEKNENSRHRETSTFSRGKIVT